MTKKILLCLVVAVFATAVKLYAQTSKPVLQFASKTHNFGTFKEEDGKQTHSFEFVNESKQPIIIKQVRTSCGCTTPSWTRKPVAPGEKGYIKASFDPKNRPGPFNKSITVTANTSPSTTILRIKGIVTKRRKTIAELYPGNINGLRMRNSHLAFTKLKNTEVKEIALDVYNERNETISISLKKGHPPHFQIKMVPEKLAPKQKGKIVATYDGSKKNDWGNVTEQVEFLINGKSESKQRVTISAHIVEDFGHLTETEKQNAPKIEFSERVFDFGELTHGKKVEHVFVLKNTGKSDLIIRKIKATCGCTAITSKTKLVKAGKETEIKVSFDSKGKRGRQNKTITVITNDPEQTSVQLRVKGTVIS